MLLVALKRHVVVCSAFTDYWYSQGNYPVHVCFLLCLQMCPSIPPSHGIVDCFTVMGYCARNNTCAQLMLKFAACVRNTGLKDTVRCHLARIRLQEYHRSHGMPLNCTCVTFPDQCSAFKAALDMPEEVSTLEVNSHLLPHSFAHS